MAVKMLMVVVSFVILCGLVGWYHPSEKVEAVCISKMLEPTYMFTQGHSSKDQKVLRGQKNAHKIYLVSLMAGSQ
jgi:hypothetical protein